MNGEIRITTGARLHCGLLSCSRSMGRQFGGAGLMIATPGFEIVVQRAESDDVGTAEDSVARPCTLSPGPSALCCRVQRFLELYRSRCPPDRQPPPCQIDIRAGIPSHVGLGSGTQLGMAVAQALSLFAGEETVLPETLARRVRRGARSALGMHGFCHGGFLVEGGKRTPDEVGTLVTRVEFPEQWRLVLTIPPGESGLSGSSERDAFARLPPMPQDTTDRLCGILLLHLVPAVIEADFQATSDALYSFGQLVGEYFAPVQGKTYAHPSMRRLVKHLRAEGIRGVGQSSWGPTIFALLPHQGAAEELVNSLSADDRWQNCQFHIARPLNTGTVTQMKPP